MKRFYAVTLLLISLVSFHCQKEVNVKLDLPDNNNPITSDPINATVQGNIFDENGNPASGVAVKVGTRNAMSDANGYFRIVNADLDRSATLVIADKPGYFRAYRSFGATEAANHVVINLTRRALSGTIPASGGELLLPGGAKLQLPEDAVVKAAGGGYTGAVNVYAAYIDPSRPDIGAAIPGSYMAENKEGRFVTLSSFGMMAVELESASGEKLQIAAGKGAGLTVPVPAALRSTAPDRISLWYLDETSGIWKEEGEAFLAGDSYVGKVKHFSFWNCDIGVPAAMISLKLINQDGLPLVHALVEMGAVLNGVVARSYGFTDSTGIIAGLVPTNQLLYLNVLSSECSEPVFSTTIGPVASASNLGTITASSSNSSIITIKGKLVNCGGLPVAEGTAMISLNSTSRYVSTDAEGQFSLALVKCANSPDEIAVVGIDKVAGQESNLALVPLVFPETNTGDLVACGNSSAQFINYKIDETSYAISSANPSDSLMAFSRLVEQPAPHYITSFSGFSFSVAGQKRIYLSFNSNAPVTGSYPIEGLTVNEFSSASVEVPATVSITNFPPANGGFFEGSFSGQFRDSLNQGSLHAISGSFRLRRQ